MFVFPAHAGRGRWRADDAKKAVEGARGGIVAGAVAVATGAVATCRFVVNRCSLCYRIQREEF
jgi:hypothetical protein